MIRRIKGIQKIAILLMAALLIFILLLSGCGIAHEVYDSSVDNLTQAQDELTLLDGNYSSLSSQLKTLTANLADLTEQIDALSSELEQAREDCAMLEASRNTTWARRDEEQDRLKALKKETESIEMRIPNLEYKLFESDDTAFSINYPSDWKALLDLQNSGSGMVILTGSSNNEAACIILYGSSDELTSQEMYDAMIEGFEESGYEYDLITEYPITVSGQEAVSGLLIVNESGIENTFYQMISVGNENNSSLIIFACLWSKYSYYAHTFGEMVDSFYLNPDYILSYSWR